MKVAVVNLGCKVNRVESDSIAQSYLQRGAEIVSYREAETVVINTCTVTGEAEKKTRKTIRKVARENSKAQLLVTGCAATINPEELSLLSDRVVIVAKSDLIDPFVSGRVGETFPTRVGIKVQDGCNHACSYCIVHVARGKAWSRPLDDVVEEAACLAQKGVKEVVLTGIDMGSYAYQDGSTMYHLVDLLERLIAVMPDTRLRLSSIEPCSVSSKLISFLADHPESVCQHLHLPLQSGSTKVLKEMYRPYDAEQFLHICTALKEAIPRLSLSTDIIVGFPGETDSDFQETLTVAKEVGFSKIHVFPYSKRQGTPAAARADQIHPDVVRKREQELLTCAEDMRCAFANAIVGTVEDIVVEQPGIGTTESYFKVEVPSSIPVGSRIKRTLTSYDPSGIFKS